MDRVIDRRYRALFWPLLLTFLMFGFSMTIIGALLPRILAEYHWSYTQAGLVLAGNAFGYFVSTLFAGILIRRFGPKVVIGSGLLLMTVSLALFGRVSDVVYNLLFNVLIGVGQGAVEVVVNYSMVRMEREGESHLMSFVHAAFSIGAIAGPSIVALILSRHLPWTVAYEITAALCGAIAVLLVLLPFRRLHDHVEEGTAKTGVRAIFRYPMLILAVSAIFIYVGLELGVSNWVAEYYFTVFHTPAARGAFMVSLFWFGVFTGRTLIPILFRTQRQAEILFSLALLLTLSLFGAIVMPGPIPAAVFFYLTSLGCSAFYPLVMTVVGRYFASAQSIAVGFAASGGGIGSLLFPLLMSAVAQSVGIRIGFVVYLVLGALLSGVAYLVMLQLRRSKVMS